MEQLKKMIHDWRALTPPLPETEVINRVREYLQILMLKFIFQSRYGNALSFMGGTSLRLCYDLKRYSEDLDFACDDKRTTYDYPDLINRVAKEFHLRGFEVSTNFNAEKTVQRAMFRFAQLGRIFEWKSFRKEQKLHVKLEVDVKPVPLKKEERESFFINRFNEIFPILKHTLPTLFAGKILAVLKRPYELGRDYYDLIWYLSHKTPLNLAYLNRGLKDPTFRDIRSVFAQLEKKVGTMDPQRILQDIQPLLEDPTEAQWIRQYKKIFDQLTAQYPIAT